MKFLIRSGTKIHQNRHPAKYCRVFILIFIPKGLFHFAAGIVERERDLLHLPEAVDDIDVNRLLVGRCRCIVEPEGLFLQRVQVVGQEYRAVVHFQLSLSVRLEIAYLVGGRLVATAPHQLAAYFGGFPDFQLLGYGQRLHRERISLLNVQTVITGADQYEGCHDVAAHEDFVRYILHIHCHI